MTPTPKELAEKIYKKLGHPSYKIDVLISLEKAILETEKLCAPKWISVKERLPEKGREYVTITKDGDFYLDIFTTNGEWHAGNEVEYWLPIPVLPHGECENILGKQMRTLPLKEGEGCNEKEEDVAFMVLTNEEWEHGTGMIAELRELWNKARKEKDV